MTDVDIVSTFLGMHIEYDKTNSTINMSQRQYLRNVVHKFEMDDCKPAATPLEKGLHLEPGDKDGSSKQPYRELIGCLTYATLTTRPDLCAAVNYFSGLQSGFNEQHYTHAKRILRYIVGSLNLKLAYRKHNDADILTGYTDADWGGDRNDRKSISGCFQSLWKRGQLDIQKASNDKSIFYRGRIYCVGPGNMWGYLDQEFVVWNGHQDQQTDHHIWR